MYRIAFIISLVIISSHTVLGLSGSGTEADPWRIESLADFDEFAGDENYWDDWTRLETDVNLAGRTYSTAVIAPDTYTNGLVFDGTAFMGVFDGNDHKITNLTIDDGGAGNYYLGLFGFIGDGGEVRNLGLEGVCVVGTGSFNGGLVGKNSGSVSNCYSAGEVRCSVDTAGAGGLVGFNDYGSVLNCHSICDVNGFDDVGGLVGSCRMGSIRNCYSIGDVSGIGDHGHIGGLVGTSREVFFFDNCYSTGDISGYRSVGGLVGWNAYSIVVNCYSTGDVNGGDAGIYIGGLAGNNQGELWYCYWDTETQTHGVTDSTGSGDSVLYMGTVGLPTSEMQTMSTFIDAGWDFEEIWDIGEKQTYPYLRHYLSADLNHDGVVNMIDFAILAGHWLEGAGQ